MESLTAQLYAFAITVLAGMTAGFFFDVYRVVRGILRPDLLSTAVMDLLFWLITGPVITLYLLIASWGELRFYIFIGILLGVSFYFLTLSRALISVLLWTSSLLGRIIGGLISLVLAVVTFPINLSQDLAVSWSLSRRARRGKRFVPKLRWQSPLSFWRR